MGNEGLSYMTEEQINEILAWIRDDRLKLAVLESQFKSSQETQREMLAEVKGLRQLIKSDMTEIVSNCRALQASKEISKPAHAPALEHGSDKPSKESVEANAFITAAKYLGAAIVGGFMALATWLKTGGGN